MPCCAPTACQPRPLREPSRITLVSAKVFAFSSLFSAGMRTSVKVMSAFWTIFTAVLCSILVAS